MNQRSNCQHPLAHRESKGIPEKTLVWLHWLLIDFLWLCGSQQTGIFLKRWEYQTTFPASWETYMKVKKQQLEPDMEQQTGSKLDCISSVQFSSVAQSCLTLCDPKNCSTSGLPVHHQLPEFTQTHVHRVSNAIQPSHPLSSPSPHVYKCRDMTCLYIAFIHVYFILC